MGVTQPGWDRWSDACNSLLQRRGWEGQESVRCLLRKRFSVPLSPSTSGSLSLLPGTLPFPLPIPCLAAKLSKSNLSGNQESQNGGNSNSSLIPLSRC